MQDIKVREEKMKERRKQTPRREFVKEICSWRALPFYKINGLISRYPESERIHSVVPWIEYISKRDELLNYGVDFLEDKRFFENFQNLFRSIPLENTLLFSGCENSEYSDQSMNAKNCYLSYVVVGGENILYSMVIKNNSINVFNCISVVRGENIYQSFNIVNSYNVFYSKQIDNSRDIRFCSNMIGCHDCILSNNLENMSYCIENKQYTKEEYFSTKKYLLSKKTEFLQKFIALHEDIVPCVSDNVSWMYLTECSNIENWYYLSSTHDSQNVMLVSWWESCSNLYDTFTATGFPTWEEYYGVMWCTWWKNVYNSVIIPRCNNTYYCHGMENCSFCLWCVGLVNKSFCILNKQYTKEQWFELANKIFESMDKDWTLGQFFPGTINPFYFNDSVAYLIDDTFTKEEIKKEWYLRREEEIKVDTPANAEVITVKELETYQKFDDIWEWTINPEIIKKVIRDEKWNVYRIVPMELEFLQKHGLPLPEIHWLERIKLWFKF